MTSTAPTPTTTAPSRTRQRLLAVLAAPVAALIVWLLAVPVLGADLVVKSGDTLQEVVAPMVVLVALVAALAGWGLLAVLERITARARLVWTVVTLVFLALSLLGPLGSAANSFARTTLVCMHLVVGAVVILLLRRSSTARS